MVDSCCDRTCLSFQGAEVLDLEVIPKVQDFTQADGTTTRSPGYVVIKELRVGDKLLKQLQIPVVSVDIPKNETDPKSDSVSIATSDNPATIAGLAEGKIILKKDFCLLKPRFFPSSIKFCD